MQGWAAAPQAPRTRLPPALVRLLGAPAQGVAVGTVLGEEAPGSIGHVGGAPGAAPRLAGLLGRVRLRVAVDALLHRHGAGTLLVPRRAEAPAQACARRETGRAAENNVKKPTMRHCEG